MRMRVGIKTHTHTIGRRFASSQATPLAAPPAVEMKVNAAEWRRMSATCDRLIESTFSPLSRPPVRLTRPPSCRAGSEARRLAGRAIRQSKGEGQTRECGTGVQGNWRRLLWLRVAERARGRQSERNLASSAKSRSGRWRPASGGAGCEPSGALVAWSAPSFELERTEDSSAFDAHRAAGRGNVALITGDLCLLWSRSGEMEGRFRASGDRVLLWAHGRPSREPRGRIGSQSTR